MKLINRQIVEIYKYKDMQEKEAHSKEMIREGWDIQVNPLIKSGLVIKYIKKERAL